MIAVTCHFDVEDWLLPDWVFNTNDMTFHLCSETQKKNRPPIELRIYEVNHDKDAAWRMFAKYHYLSHSHNNAAHVYVCTANDELAAFCSVLPFPHAHLMNARREHRTVVLPDFQGAGIGTAFSDAIAQMYTNAGYTYISTTSNPAFIHARAKSPKWIVTRLPGRTQIGAGKFQNASTIGENVSSNRITSSFKYIGQNGKSKT